MKLILTVEINNLMSNVALLNQYGEIQLNFFVNHDFKNGLIENLYEKINTNLKKVGYELNDLYEKMGIAAAGYIDHNEGIVRYAGLLNFNNFNLKQKAQELFKKEVLVLNDANASALGEFWIGSAKHSDSLIFYKINCGIGGAIILEGKLVSGSRGFAGEFGHGGGIYDGKETNYICFCGAKGCIEAISGTKNIQDKFSHYINQNPNSKLAIFFNDKELVTLEDINLAYELKIDNEEIEKIFCHLLNPLIKHMATMINALDPESIIISGEIIVVKQIVFRIIKKEIYTYIIDKVADEINIKEATLGKDAPLIGAGYYVINDWKFS
ncbi:glucokinase [Spiroplasma gladiatoris]|uniref:Glucokinase n=1 Tax=Spiroplasma gladiatoris TaxID=2143 RepID=A0A4V1AQ92_9MOLU|nr:ROK family protein [Spiroplasma gladiatoris]QBQ07689.1 glucokinase [Spiroplasma gladiatoris]